LVKSRFFDKIWTVKRTEKLITTLRKKSLSVALAESATGGFASYLFTKTAGASKVFKGGVVLYSLESKHKLFKIPLARLKRNQGVSKEIAATLAQRIRKKFNSSFGGAIVGFAGPGAKAGAVILSLSDKEKVISIETLIKGNRDRGRKRASQLLLELIYSRAKKLR